MGNTGNTIFVPDLHGRKDILLAVLQTYGADSEYRFLGDYIDGSLQEPELLRVLRDMHDIDVGNVVMGNHEFDRIRVVKAAQHIKNYLDDDIDGYKEIARVWVNHKKLGIPALAAYGIEASRYRHPEDAVLALYERMEMDGLFTFICSMSMFYEDDGHVAIHAGLTEQDWSEQKEDLVAAKTNILNSGMLDEPEQLFSHKLAKSDSDFSATDKVVATGHSPSNRGENHRISADGRRVMLDSFNRDGIFVYESANQRVVPISGT